MGQAAAGRGAPDRVQVDWGREETAPPGETRARAEAVQQAEAPAVAAPRPEAALARAEPRRVAAAGQVETRATLGAAAPAGAPPAALPGVLTRERPARRRR